MLAATASNILNLSPYIQMALNIGSLCVMLYALKKFIGTPHDDMLARVAKAEQRLDKVENSLNLNWEGFRDHKASNNESFEVIQQCLLALIDFEISYCIHTQYGEGDNEKDIKDLEEAKQMLRKHLSKR